jgi:hypothetical protein
MWIEGTADSQNQNTGGASGVPAMPKNLRGQPENLPSASQLGEMAKQWAPDMPPEIVNAVFNVESRHGTNPASWTSRDVGKGRTVIGPGQIQDSPFSWQAGNPKSLAEAYFPSTKLGVAYEKGNLEHVTIASLAFMNEKWNKAKGDVQAFADSYHGKGTSNNGETNITYAAKLKDAANGTSQNAINFFAGRGQPESQIAANSSQTTNVSDLAAKQSEARRLGQEANTVIAKSGEDIINAMLEVKAAGTEVIKTAYKDSVAKAEQAKDFMTRAFGYDITGGTGNAAAAAKALDKNLGDILNLKEGLDRNRANPIYAILDGMSGGKVSKEFTDNIKQREQESTAISNALGQIQARTSDFMQIGAKTVSSMSEAETRARVTESDAIANQKIAVQRGTTNIKLVENDQKIDKLISVIESKSVAQSLQQDKFQLQQAQAEFNHTIKLRDLAAKENKLNDPLIAEARQAAIDLKQEQLAKMQEAVAEKARVAIAVEKASKILGVNSDVLGKNYAAKDKATVDLITSLSKEKPELGTLRLLDSKGLLTTEDSKFVRRAIGQGGWASPATNSTVANYTARVDAEFEKVAPAKNNQEFIARQVLLDNAKAESIGLMQRGIVNTAGLKDGEKNPYAAQHKLILSQNDTLLGPVIATTEGKAAYEAMKNSQLTKLMRAESSKVAVGDDTVLNNAAYILRTDSSVNARDAARQVVDYFKFAALVNNTEKHYEAVGIRPQTEYGVKLTATAGNSFANIFSAASGSNFSRAGTTYPEFGQVKVPTKEIDPTKAVGLDMLDQESVTAILLKMAIQREKIPQ